MVLIFSSGASDVSIECMNVTIREDNALEIDKTFSVTLTISDDDVDVVNSMMTVTITDNDSKLRCYYN